MDKKKILIIDTCLACVWLEVPGMEKAGDDNDCWDLQRVEQKIKAETDQGALLVLPVASIIETGNHITQVKRRERSQYVDAFVEMIRKGVDGQAPWIVFEQKTLWDKAKLREMAEKWKELNDGDRHSLGDVSILYVASYYRKAGFDVEILTADALLKSYESVNLDEVEVVNRPRRYRQ